MYVKTPDLIRHGSLEKLTDGLLYGISNRGWDATGLAAFTEDWSNPYVEKMADEAKWFIAHRDNLPVNPRAVLLHTRWTTQGSELYSWNNHPVRYGSVLTVHNGVIWNDYSLFNKLGLKRKAEVDTEAISAALFLHGFDKAKEALSEIAGSFAIASAYTTQPDTVLLARGAESPLAIHESENLIVWASTPEAIVTGWGYGIGTPPKMNKIRRIPEGTLITINREGMRKENFSVQRGYTRYYDSCTPAWSYKSKDTEGKDTLALPPGSSYEYSQPSKSRTYLACNACKELVPWDEMVSGSDGFMICSDCMLYGEHYQSHGVQCEFCGSSKQITQEMGMPVCQSCMDMLLQG